MNWKKLLLGKVNYTKTTDNGKYNVNIDIQGGILSVVAIIALITWLVHIL